MAVESQELNSRFLDDLEVECRFCWPNWKDSKQPDSQMFLVPRSEERAYVLEQRLELRKVLYISI